MTDEEFRRLLEECRPAAERFVRFRVSSRFDADDILAETCAAAWSRRNSLRDISSFRSWLISIARSKCADHMRSSARRNDREGPVPDIGERAGKISGIDGAYTAVGETMALMDADKRRLLYMVYWQEMSQKEIAARLKIPTGTVKSRLSAAKDQFRKNYTGHIADTPEKGGKNMGMNTLPETLPEYSIRYAGEPFPVVCGELMGWFAVPEKGEKVSWAMYDLPSRRRDMVYEITAGRPVEIHGISGIGLTAKGYLSGDYTALMEEPVSASGVLSDEWSFAAQLTDTRSRFLAAAHKEDGVMKYRTFLDGDEFLDNWGFGENNEGFEIDLARKGDIIRRGDQITAKDKKYLLDVVGRYEVTIDGTAHDTVCLMDIGSYTDGTASEQYIGRDGRTVLWRRFNSDRWHIDRYGSPWSELLPGNERIFINGGTYVHWYDCLICRDR